MFNELGGKETMNTILYHGSTLQIAHPLCNLGRQNHDFGPGFYVTNSRNQATEWATRVSIRRGEPGIINRYLVDRDAMFAEARTLQFLAYDEEWLQFIVRCRQGYDPRADYDLVEGGVANDRVIDTVRLYMQGLIPVETALERLSMHQPNHQICMLRQSITDKYLIFDGAEEL